METQNITLSLPRALLRKAKVVAALRATSVSALVTASLEQVVRDDDDYEAAMERTLARARGGYGLGSGGHVNARRDEVHDR